MRSFSTLVLAALLAAAPAAALGAPSDEEIQSIAAARADYDRGRRAVDRMDWKEAIAAFASAARHDPGNAEFQNMLGFAYRSSGNMEAAFRHYRKALELNPAHRGAHEYIGRAYLMVDQPQKALEHLEFLEKDCFGICRERDLLKKAIEDYPWPPPGRTVRNY